MISEYSNHDLIALISILSCNSRQRHTNGYDGFSHGATHDWRWQILRNTHSWGGKFWKWQSFLLLKRFSDTFYCLSANFWMPISYFLWRFKKKVCAITIFLLFVGAADIVMGGKDACHASDSIVYRMPYVGLLCSNLIVATIHLSLTFQMPSVNEAIFILSFWTQIG